MYTYYMYPRKLHFLEIIIQLIVAEQLDLSPVQRPIVFSLDNLRTRILSKGNSNSFPQL